jgi:DNA topoisomerase-1
LLVESSDSAQAVVDPRDAAESAGLGYVSDDRPGIRRTKAGSGFTYTRADGTRLTERNALKRIKALAIPPAWTDVWICPFADGHIQATGRDAKGRKQYRYHARFREVRESTKYEHVVEFADELPHIREKVREHMGLRGLPREKVLATVVHLLECRIKRGVWLPSLHFRPSIVGVGRHRDHLDRPQSGGSSVKVKRAPRPSSDF